MNLDVQSIIFEFLGGLGIFLIGIKSMGDGLQKSAGDRLRDILDRFTSNPLLGIFAGIVVTALIQSSSATTVLTIGLVNAGFMTLRQAIGVIMGVNIGTTFTAFIIGLDIGEYALPILAVGCFLLFFFKNQKVNAVGQAVFGFGALFLGLELMSSGMSPLRDLEFFHELTINMSDNPILGVVIGTVFTMIVQSSTATIGILQGLYADAALTLDAALPVLLGDNIGTTITAVLAGIGASVAAKRSVLTHVSFNLIGAAIFIVLLVPFTKYVAFLESSMSLNGEMTLAFAHASYNLANAAIQFPFIGALAWMVTKLVPGKDVTIEYTPKHLDPRFINQSTSLALGQAKEEVIRMGEYASQALEETSHYLTSQQPKHAELGMQIEGALNHLDQEITQYLINLSSGSMSEAESATHSALLDAVRDLERIGDHAENIIELIEYNISNKVDLTDLAIDDLNEMFDLTILTVKKTVQALKEVDKEKALDVLKKEERIDEMEQTFRKKHIIRMNEGLCDPTAGIVFVDIISDLERIGDHAVNIAEEVLNANH